MTISLTPEIEDALEAQARQRGTTPERLAQEILAAGLREMAAHDHEEPAPETGLEEGSLADLFAGRIGVIRSSEYVPGGARLSQDSGRKFAAGLVEKRRRGKL
jgi:hypothetical protein